MEERKNVESKDEIKTDKSSYKKAKIKTWIIVAVFAVIIIGIGILGNIFLGSIACVYIAAAFYAIVLLVWLPQELKRVKNNFCQECGAKYNYQNCVEWQVNEVEIKEKRTNPNSEKKQIIGVRIEHVNIVCTCPKCGNKNSFDKKYQTGEIYDNGAEKLRNVESLIKKYFKV